MNRGPMPDDLHGAVSRRRLKWGSSCRNYSSEFSSYAFLKYSVQKRSRYSTFCSEKRCIHSIPLTTA
jgi:hypothetical protein